MAAWNIKYSNIVEENFNYLLYLINLQSYMACLHKHLRDTV